MSVWYLIAMSERRSVFILFIGLMLCISLWRISLQEIHTEYTPYDAIESMNYMNNSSRSNTTAPMNPAQMPTASLDLLTKNDENVLIDLKHFDYIINQVSCDESNVIAGDSIRRPIALILVHSAPQNWNKRNIVRETWGRKNPRARIYFLLGAVNSTLLQVRLKQENNLYQDLIQGNFFDIYRNMTYKHTMALKWFVYNCPKLKYLIKTDDDVFVNTPAVLDFLEADTRNERNFLFCYRIEDARIKRTYRSKWRVSTKEFPGWYYPPYCPGFTIIYSNDVVWRLYREAQRTPYFWIDDVHITGSLAQHLNLNITAFGKYYMNDSVLNSLIDGRTLLTDMHPMFLFTEPNLREKQIRQLWNIIENAYR